MSLLFALGEKLFKTVNPPHDLAINSQDPLFSTINSRIAETAMVVTTSINTRVGTAFSLTFLTTTVAVRAR